MMRQDTGFFNQSSIKNKIPLRHPFIDVGGKPFIALTVALLDCLKHTKDMNQLGMEKLVKSFMFYFPKNNLSQSYQTSEERLKTLIHSGRHSDLIVNMAYVLQQLVVDEIYSHPVAYREAFDGFNKNTPKTILRELNAPIPPCVFCTALAKILGITVVLSITEPGKELRKREIYSSDTDKASKVELTFEVQKDYYFPHVKYESNATSMHQWPASKPMVTEGSKSETMAEFIELIALDNQRLLELYSKWRQNLLTMLQVGELTIEQLMHVYIQSLNKSADPTQLFGKLVNEVDKPEVLSIFNSKRKEALLVESVARLISIGLIDPDDMEQQFSEINRSIPS